MRSTAGSATTTSTLDPGDDRLLSRDGLADVVGCGAGNDEVDADTLDQIAADCEIVTRVATAPPAGYVPDKPGHSGGRGRRRDGADARPLAPGSRLRDLERERDGERLRIPRDRRPEVAADRRVAPGRHVGGAGAAITYKLSRRPLPSAPAKALAAGRKVRVRLSVVGTDPGGNSSEARAPKIRLVARRVERQGRRTATAGPSCDIPSPATSTVTRSATASTTARSIKNGSQINTDEPRPTRPPAMPAGDATATPATTTTTPTGSTTSTPPVPSSTTAAIDRNPDQDGRRRRRLRRCLPAGRFRRRRRDQRRRQLRLRRQPRPAGCRRRRPRRRLRPRPRRRRVRQRVRQLPDRLQPRSRPTPTATD